MSQCSWAMQEEENIPEWQKLYTMNKQEMQEAMRGQIPWIVKAKVYNTDGNEIQSVRRKKAFVVELYLKKSNGLEIYNFEMPNDSLLNGMLEKHRRRLALDMHWLPFPLSEFETHCTDPRDYAKITWISEDKKIFKCAFAIAEQATDRDYCKTVREAIDRRLDEIEKAEMAKRWPITNWLRKKWKASFSKDPAFVPTGLPKEGGLPKEDTLKRQHSVEEKWDFETQLQKLEISWGTLPESNSNEHEQRGGKKRRRLVVLENILNQISELP